MSRLNNGLYRTCSDCGANLDPNEKCDCEDIQWYFDHIKNAFIVTYKGLVHTFEKLEVQKYMKDIGTVTITFDMFKILIDNKLKGAQ